MFEKYLLTMYQQWCQGNESYSHRYMDFVELVAKQQNISADAVMRELQKYYWFKRPESY